jgi:hypothetical protein
MRGIVVAAAVQDAVEVEALLARDHVELIRDRELDVPRRVRHQLAELRLHRRHLDELVDEAAEEVAHGRERLGPEGR